MEIPNENRNKVARKSYSAFKKLEIISDVEVIGNRAAAKKHGIDERNIRRWMKAKQSLRSMKQTKRCNRYKSAKWPELELELRQWIIEQRRAKFRVTTTAARLHAKVLARKKSTTDFTASCCWFQRFKKRAGLSVRFKTSVGQHLPADWLEKVELFRAYVAEKKASCNIAMSQIVNMDEVPCSFDLPENRTLDEKGNEDISLVTTGNEKTNFTIVLGISASGEKLTPMIIFKRKSMPKDTFPDGIIVRVNPKGWINAELMEDWMENVFRRRKSAFFSNKKPEECLLIYDACKAHLTDEVKACVKNRAQLAVIPGGLTKALQPLDISVNKSFKTKLRLLWDEWIMNEGTASYTKGGKRRKAGLVKVCEWVWVLSAWREITVETIKNGFKKAGLESYSNEAEVLEQLAVMDDEHELAGKNNV